MNLDELFDQAARVAEPELHADVLGGVRRAQARRRRRQLIAVPVACVTIAVGLLAPTLLLHRDDAGPVGPTTTSPPATGAPTTPPPPATPEPTVVVGLFESHAMRLDLTTGGRTDLGPASAVTLHAGKPWLSRPKALCDGTIITPTSSFDAHGAVAALEVSPDGKTLAYVRAAGPASKDYPNFPCARRWLVLRDVASGGERSWPADDGSLWGLSWSADSQHLAYTFNGCCGDFDPNVYVLDITATPGNVYDVLALPTATGDCTNNTPVFSGRTLLLVVRCGSAPETYELRDAATGSLVMALNANTDAVSADASGQHLLVSTYGPGDPRPTLFATRLRDHYQRQLIEGLSDPHW